RITGTAFSTQENLDRFIQRRQDAIKYDHRRLGKELDLFSFHEEGIGFPFFHPNGKALVAVTDQDFLYIQQPPQPIIFLQNVVYQFQSFLNPKQWSFNLWFIH
ncbi:hypothetical protein LCGC14_2689320, partial [marine sediment metagenome]